MTLIHYIKNNHLIPSVKKIIIKIESKMIKFNQKKYYYRIFLLTDKEKIYFSQDLLENLNFESENYFIVDFFDMLKNVE